ncbi:MAG TPA: TIGR00730 family Rossman fold protein [Bryobacteraceae bacterium]|nr:TIGR00730 family Rossman fold protein [Bryobacteraceae bacterium]
MRRICVFCGSSPGARPRYMDAAKNLAQYLAANKVAIVFGGSNLGLMGVLADTALKAGGDVIGVIPQNLVEREVSHPGLRDLRVVNSMHERKALMAELSDAFIAMPGGFGTFEEFCEVLTWSQLGLHGKPCGLLNVEGYFDHLLALFDHAVAEKFLKPEHRRMVIADSCPESLVERLREYHTPRVEKWIDRAQT